MDLTPDKKEILSCFVKKDKVEGVVLLDVNNILPCMVAFRIGWFIEGSLEYYTPWTPVTPDYLQVVATYLAWVGSLKNLSIKCQVKAIDEDTKDTIYNSIHNVFCNFAYSVTTQEGIVSQDGRAKMGDKNSFVTDKPAPPRVNVSFEQREVHSADDNLMEVLNEALEDLLKEEK